MLDMSRLRFTKDVIADQVHRPHGLGHAKCCYVYNQRYKIHRLLERSNIASQAH